MTGQHPGVPLNPVEAKACCAATYSSDLVEALLGKSYHPGGLALTRRLLTATELRTDQRLLDVASGIGTTSYVAVAEFGAIAHGIDLSEANVKAASEGADARHLGDRVHFQLGDAEALPVTNASYDVIVCECALCIFPDKQTAVSEMVRVLRPGGRIGITDVTAERTRLPPELTSLFAWVACIADARPTQEYAALLEDAGLRIELVEPHDDALSRMVDQIEARLTLLNMTSPSRVLEFGLNLGQAKGVMAATRRAMAEGTLGYTLIVARLPV